MTQPGNLWTRWRVRAGYFIAAGYLILATPTTSSMAWGAGIAALGIVARSTAAGHLRKHEELTTTGPYAWTRNPLYFGSALLAAGFALASRSLLAAALVAAYFASFYSVVMKTEEKELRTRYGPVFEEYAARVPLFFPMPPRASALPKTGAAENQFSWQVYKQNREYRAFVGYLVGLLLLWARMRRGG